MQDIIHPPARRAVPLIPLSHPIDRMPVSSRAALVTSGSLILLVFLAGACASRPPAPGATSDPSPAEPVITTGGELLEAMHARYQGRWFRTLSFVQNNTLYPASGGEQKTQWLEHMSVPGKLRIDYLPLAGRSGVLYEGGRVHVFDNGRRVQSQPGVNPLLLLGFDVYAQPVAATAKTLDSLGFNLGIIHRAEWQGRRAIVVGAAAGDTTTNQFWVDAERLLFMRLIQRNPAGTVISDQRFNRYTDIDGFPIAIEVLMLRNGRPYFKEEYTSVRINQPIPAEVFDSARWVEAQPRMPVAPPPDVQ
jgi:hypothetical protein